jgi:beta-N-acetylhexosaminidase
VEIDQAVRRGRASGLYLFSSQLAAPDLAATAVSRWQAAATVPLLVAVDAEAGLGRIVPGATHLPTMMALGATGDPALAREAAQVTAAEARACRINTVLSGVLATGKHFPGHGDTSLDSHLQLDTSRLGCSGHALHVGGDHERGGTQTS